MGWPLSSPIAPNVDPDLAAVPTTSTDLETVPVWLLGAVFTNTSNVTRLVTITDTAGLQVIYQAELPPTGIPMNFEWSFLRLTGLKWYANASGVVGKIWGWK